ncbi:hypothetical protein DH2020_042930 [Rehmannia glutinosa]|uniref:R2R3-MYB protein n=1 Tax=Rehmannia glutinosa TaxID=99300 RepID=A0ABR0ULI8_REHGL
MGRPPCCDKIGVKKGPWTPEEDIILVSYIQEHGPGNWRAVPTNTGLLRCSKSCRLRWAAIASYLPQRTDNDIKNYWNTHLKKKLQKLQGHHHDENGKITGNSSSSSSDSKSISKGQWERRLQTDIHMAKKALCEALSLDKPNTSSSIDSKTFSLPQQTSTYASSTENIARLLENWTKKSTNSSSQAMSVSESTQSTSFNNPSVGVSSSPSEGAISTNFAGFNSSNSEFSAHEAKFEQGINVHQDESKTEMPLSFLEKWLLDDAGVQGQDGYFMDMAASLGETADLF